MRSLLNRLPGPMRALLEGALNEDTREIRLRVGRPLEIRGTDGESRLLGPPQEKRALDEAVSALAGHSVYALEEHMREGYFSLPGGYRVGLAGAYSLEEGNVRALSAIGSVSIRIAREIRGAADCAIGWIRDGRRVRSALVISAPMMGKTTLLRDLARQISDGGLHVALADERGELAGCREGVPRMDVGALSDVADGLPKHIAMELLVRAMSPEVIVTDELGRAQDAEAVCEAVRSGVAVLASAHADSFARARSRRALAPLFEDALFERVLLLSGAPGRLAAVMDGRGETLWRAGQYAPARPSCSP